MRLNKFIADCIAVSRRKADALIIAGDVRVNRKPATLGQEVNPERDVVTVSGNKLEPQRKRYVLFYKPAGVITTRTDPEGRRTIYDILPQKYHHLDPVGRLDRESSGLLLLTNDGDLANCLAHPRYAHQKHYRVAVDKPLTPDTLTQLEAGLMLQPEGKLAQCRVIDVIDEKTVVLGLKTGLNRQIRRTLEMLGYSVVKLKRIQMAGLSLGALRPSETRELKLREVQQLRRLKDESLGVSRKSRHPRQKSHASSGAARAENARPKAKTRPAQTPAGETPSSGQRKAGGNPSASQRKSPNPTTKTLRAQATKRPRTPR